ncbi:MAG: hypothetical protein ACO1TE_08405 [Prosthecobacter sp.]
MTASFPFRVTHQFRTEWRHHRGWIVAWIVWTVLHRLYQSRRENDYVAYLQVDDLVPVITLLLAATLAWLCVRGDSPSNTDCATLTRPMGQKALWLGKLAFLACAVVLPLLVAEMTRWSGFEHGPVRWLALMAGVLLSMGLVLGGVAALTALASSTRQIIAIAVLGVLAAGLWLTLGGSLEEMSTLRDGKPGADAARACGGIVATVIGAGCVAAAWWLATVPRRRAVASAVLVLGGLQAPLLMAAWKKDWLTPPPLSYPSARLAVKTGKADPADKTPGRVLWPTLRITGLGKNEVASVIDFAPVDEDGAQWPPLGSYTDLPPHPGGFDTWLHLDHARALLKHSTATTLWQHQLMNPAMYNGRPPLEEALKPLRLDPQAMPARWRLRLAVHEMRRFASLPFKQLWTQENTFNVRPGTRLELRPFHYSAGSWEMPGRVHSFHSSMLPPRAHAPAVARGRPLSDGFFLVTEDPELRENSAYDLGPARGGGMVELMNVEAGVPLSVRVWTPAVQHFLLKTRHEDWVGRLHASLWHAEERGTVDLELTAAQMAEVLAKPPSKPEVKKP